MVFLHTLLCLVLFAQNKLLLEEPKLEPQEAKSVVASDLEVLSQPSVVAIEGDGMVPNYYQKSHFYSSLSNVIEERGAQTCMQASALCYVCKQKDNYFEYEFLFSNQIGESKKCELYTYSISMKKDSSAEEKIVQFLKQQKLQIDGEKLNTPMVFELDKYQIYVKTEGDSYQLNFIMPELKIKLQSINENLFFLKKELSSVWPKYLNLTKQYLEEMSSAKLNKEDLESKKEFGSLNEKQFISEMQTLYKNALKIKGKEERSCMLYKNKDLLDYQVNDDLNKKLQLSARYHWSESFQSSLKDTVCGNYYFLERMKDFLIKKESCPALPVVDIVASLNAFQKQNISQMEKEISQLLKVGILSKTKNQIHSSLGEELKLLESVNKKFTRYSDYLSKRLDDRQANAEIGTCIH